MDSDTLTWTRDRIRQLATANRQRKVATGEERWLSAYSDASYKEHRPHAGAAWGIWVRTDRHRIIRAGPCPAWVYGKGAMYAELHAVYMAVVTALDGLDPDANIMVVKTDCKSLLRSFGWGGRLKFLPEDEALSLVLDAFERADAAGVRLIVKWVKGHARTDTTQGYLNDRVDRLAGKARETGRVVEWSKEVDDWKEVARKLKGSVDEEVQARAQGMADDGELLQLMLRVNRQLYRGEFTSLNRELRETRPEAVGLDHCLSLLTVTLAARSKLPDRRKLRARVAGVLHELGEDPEETLFGL